MSRTSSKISIARLVKICALKGLRHVVISPGSRNAPLIISFGGDDHFSCINITDERVAAFFALGIAQKTKTPVILCCTSGSAVLNYAPAISEAYYQKIPLLILTADRPVEWIDQRAGQTMRQRNVYANYIKGSFELIEEAQQEEHIWYNDRIVNEAINLTMTGSHGPVHLNIPLREPLYDQIDATAVEMPKSISRSPVVLSLSSDVVDELKLEWSQAKGILVIIGQGNPGEEFNLEIESIARLPNVVVLTETTSNVKAHSVFPSIDRLIDSIQKEEYASFTPDIIVSCGTAIVSKKLRFMLRQMDIKAHWHVNPDDGYVDTYQSLTRLIPVQPDVLFKALNQFEKKESFIDFKSAWTQRELSTTSAHVHFLKTCPWSDLKVMQLILSEIPGGFIHLASSTPIRYAQLFPSRPDATYYCNRGVSGIDGCTSTAAGFAYVCNGIVTLITGDLSFFYDSNALWHHHVSKNLKIILINNEGGNIFRYVKGPDTTNHLEEHFEATHQTDASGIAKAFDANYISAKNEKELYDGIEILFDPTSEKVGILEIFTPRELNIPILKSYFTSLRP